MDKFENYFKNEIMFGLKKIIMIWFYKWIDVKTQISASFRHQNQNKPD